MKALDVLRRRWGQWLCFAAGAWMLGDAAEHGYHAEAISGSAFMLTGLGLRAIAVWRERMRIGE